MSPTLSVNRSDLPYKTLPIKRLRTKMTAQQQIAARIDAINRELEQCQSNRQEWVRRRQTCTSHLDKIHTHPVNPRDRQGKKITMKETFLR
jgi:hypothetical protein